MGNRAGSWALVICVLGILAAPIPSLRAGEVVASPNGLVQFRLDPKGAEPIFEISLGGKPAVEPSTLAITIDGVSLTAGATVAAVARYQVNETYPLLGGHATAVNQCNGATVTFHRRGVSWRLEVRAYDDGVAFRYAVDGDNGPRIPDEGTRIVLPAGTTAWCHDLRGHYEGVHVARDVADIPAGNWAAPPLTARLPGGAGYAVVTEAALVNYPGMALRAEGDRGFRIALGHLHPASYPFTLRYKDDVERLAKPAALTGPITSPWRVVMLGTDLNALVNSDLITNLCPPPDKALFPDGSRTAWVKPGRAVWKYLDGGESTLDGMKEFCRLAGELGFEYCIVEGFWKRWDESQLRDLIATGKKHGVGIWLWKHSKELRDPAARAAFFGMCQNLGVAGVKIDFFDHEAKEIIDLYQTLLRETAEHQLLVNFHGSNKPTGESRTWPNELVREAVKGMESSKLADRARHDATLPFTRFLAGPADYTPLHFGTRRGNTTWVHQVGTTVAFTAPLLTYGAHPKTMLDSSYVSMLKSIPTVWDETIILPASAIGEVAAFARRRGDSWFLAVVNGPVGRTLQVPLSFLGDGGYRALVVQDKDGDPAATHLEETIACRRDTLTIRLSDGGGYVARYSPKSD
jgi:alpha-glucosidase